jgi:AbrB family looped-hinge helix DNA binding protein
MSEVVKITKKGQATIPKHLREKFGFTDRAIVVEAEDGIIFKPVPDISKEKGSLKDIFEGKTVKELIDEVRREDREKERSMKKYGGI